MKPLFQRQCEALVKTLTKGKQRTNNKSVTLDMNTWVDEKHYCGTAACVCGYQALSGELETFPIAAEGSGNHNAVASHAVASHIAYDLDASCCALFGDGYLACSIYLASAAQRFISARDAAFTSEKTLRTFKHLITENTSLDDAITYIEFVIEKCKEISA